MKNRVLTFYQSYNVTTTDYVEHFKALVGVVEMYGGAYGNETGLIKAQLAAHGVAAADLNSPNPTELKKGLEVCRKEYLSCMILQGSDNTRFYQLKIDLANSMTMKQDKFLKTMVETQGLLNNYKTPPRQQCAKDLDSNGITFIQIGPPCKARTVANIDCWHSQKKGHYKSNCLKLKAQELDVGMQNLDITICNKVHSLFSANEGLTMVQEEKKEK
jgi:hypothetical protein